MYIRNRLICKLWSLVYSKWIEPDHRVRYVKGWRTALIDSPGGSRRSVTPLIFPWETGRMVPWERTDETQ